MDDMQNDYLIVGGGTAGAVIAARLSEDPACRVLLIEAGDDVVPGDEPADIRDPFPAATLNPHYFWSGLTATASDGGAPAPYPQARVMGGGSSINGLYALRGVPSDYARWAEAGGGDFSWDGVLPRFQGIENDRDRQDHRAGWHAVSRTPKNQWPDFVRAMAQAAERDGLPFVPDSNPATASSRCRMPSMPSRA